MKSLSRRAKHGAFIEPSGRKQWQPVTNARRASRQSARRRRLSLAAATRARTLVASATLDRKVWLWGSNDRSGVERANGSYSSGGGGEADHREQDPDRADADARAQLQGDQRRQRPCGSGHRRKRAEVGALSAM